MFMARDSIYGTAFTVIIAVQKSFKNVDLTRAQRPSVPLCSQQYGKTFIWDS